MKKEGRLREAIRKIVNAVAPKDAYSEKMRGIEDATRRITVASERLVVTEKEKASP